MKKLILFLLILTILTINGCLTGHWYKADKNLEECQQDWAECDKRHEDVKIIIDDVFLPEARYVRAEKNRGECMLAKNYQFLSEKKLPEGVRKTKDLKINFAGK